MINKFNIFLCLNALIIGSASLAMDVRIKMSSDALVHEGGEELCNAASKGNVQQVKILLQEGIPVDSKSNTGLTPLMIGAQNNHKEVCLALLEHNAQIDLKNNFGVAALRMAALYDHIEICRLLIDETIRQSILPGAMVALLGIKKFNRSPLMRLIDHHLINQIAQQAYSTSKLKDLFAQIYAIEERKLCTSSLLDIANQQIQWRFFLTGDSYEKNL